MQHYADKEQTTNTCIERERERERGCDYNMIICEKSIFLAWI
jgi:hypothetical protein